MDVIIATPDHDLWQLADAKVCLFDPLRKK